MNRRRTSARGSYVKGIILLAVLLVGLFIYNKVSREGVPGYVVDVFSDQSVDVREVDQYSEAEQDSVRKAAAGFWTYRSERDGKDMPMAVRDRIELRENGIIWRVRTETLYLPSGDSTSFTHISHAFLIPFGRLDAGMSVSEVHFIGLVWIHDNDTCYTPIHKKIPDFDSHAWTRVAFRNWIHQSIDTTFILHGREYSPYGDADLAAFFPAGAIGLIDSINIGQCPHSLTHGGLVKEAVLEDVKDMTVDARLEERVRRLVDTYYIDYCLKPVLEKRSTGTAPATGTIE
ncbi:MAG: hypothetical protein GF418_10375, partial [Chitinivibrionales bacterium]|nr:hypothetical protein [Chitinivibrionales bacterium]MBD3396018.1 hypothetical protein [Chitinivibrionales bacterium]